ncbi:MAG: type II toxin-antitoxin system RelE/ParE family toxin [Rhodospirillales bacterium]|nr:type II toxin-antitoxin system RelE/ParE family toxin [Rhodospirillales bacterium]
MAERFEVWLLEDAERDIEDIGLHIAANDAVEKAEAVLRALEAACQGLERLPQRGNIPKELAAIGLTDFREVHYKPYRVIYRIIDRKVFVFGVFDGRRDMQSLLQRRLLR